MRFCITLLFTIANIVVTFGMQNIENSKLCPHTIDNPSDPLHGMIRAGDDISCDPMEKGADNLTMCIERCCLDNECMAYSYNWPWSIGPYMNCEKGKVCCCLKSSAPPLEKNKWNMNITTGVVPSRPYHCSSSLDCSLNGDCIEGTCVCDAGWKDDDCGELNLLPAKTLDGAYQHKINPKDCRISCGPSSWGGLPLKGDQGKYHLFASQFVQNCTLKGWNPGSTVIRAVSDDPFGPYIYKETVFGTFHHNPTVRKLTASQSGTGKPLYVMYMIGDDVPPPEKRGAKCDYDSSKDPHHLEGYITIAWAENLLGPWTKSKHLILTSGSVNNWDAMVTNPAPLFLDNGTTYIFFRGTQWPVNGIERIGLARAETWKGPYGRISDDPLWGPFDDRRKFVEDPFVWQDKRGFKMLSHGHWDENGYFAYSEHVDGPWQFRVKPSYTNVVKMINGTSIKLVQRERPQLWFDETTKEPSILFTGVAPPGASFYGYTYTFAQRINITDNKNINKE